MLKDINSTAILAVRDMDRARQFYAQVLGLHELSHDDHLARFQTGGTAIVLYVSDQAGSNTANALVWDAGDQIEEIAADLAAKGVVFEHYPEMGMTFSGGLHRAGDFKACWFKDPDGNILHINSM